MTYTKIIVLVVVLIILVISFQQCVLVKAIVYNYPDKKDSKRFENHTAAKSKMPFYFKQSEKDYGDELYVDDWKTEEALRKTIRQHLKDHNSTGFMLIRNDTVLYEEYFDGNNRDTLFPSYSLAKSFLSILIGIAIDEGKIKSEEEFAVSYIPELKDVDKFKELKIIDLLNHTSGIKPNKLIDAHLYYGNDIWKALNKIKFEKDPGTFQRYQNVNAQLLGLILKRATNKTVTAYLEEKIWKKIGTEHDGFWSISKKDQIEKTFCCMGASSTDYARFGRLMLNRGDWEGEQLVSEEWMKKTLARDTRRGASWAYNKSWYLGLEEYGDFMAIGLYKQFIYICPLKNIVIVRFGGKEKKLHEEKARWARVFRELVDQL